jgi:hypothetical protein
LGVQKRFRFGSDFRKTYYRPIRSCAGQIDTPSPELLLKLSLPTSPDRSRKVRPGPNGRGAERVGCVVEKNCIMWVDKLVLWEYTGYSQLDDLRFGALQPKSCCRSNKNAVMSVSERKSIYCAYLGEWTQYIVYRRKGHYI